MQDKIVVIDLGSPYTQLIARQIRRMNVYCEIHPYTNTPKMDSSTKGIILSGIGTNVRVELNNKNTDGGEIPILGIGGGMYSLFTTSEKPSKEPLMGVSSKISIDDSSDPLVQFSASQLEVMGYLGVAKGALPKEASVIASGKEDGTVAIFRVGDKQCWGVAFHLELSGNEMAKGDILHNFTLSICGCKPTWSAAAFADHMVEELRKQLGEDRVILALSGGVDSTVAGVLLHRAIGDRLSCVFVNTGLLRKDEFRSVLESYKGMGLNVEGVDASDKFLSNLKGVSEPEKKRKSIGRDFIEVFEEHARRNRDVKWLAQGTIYPDVIESISVDGKVAVKSHHNVGGLPEKMNLKIVEPLRLLFKDEVRRVGRVLGITESILERHPFPGPGLGIRVLEEVTPQKVRILQEADSIYIEGLREFGLYEKVWQAAAILLPVQSVGVNDAGMRSYEYCLALRAVNSVDGMTADWVDLPHKFLAEISNRIIKGVEGINRVVYDISSKPPATIEWE